MLSKWQVFPGAWTAILVSLDNVGIWNLRTQELKAWYLGQETYVNVINPEITNKTELAVPDNVIYCGVLSGLQKYVALFVSYHYLLDYLVLDHNQLHCNPIQLVVANYGDQQVSH